MPDSRPDTVAAWWRSFREGVLHSAGVEDEREEAFARLAFYAGAIALLQLLDDQADNLEDVVAELDTFQQRLGAPSAPQ